MIRGTLIGIFIAVVVTGCGRDAALRCAEAEAYHNAAERPPIRVPDDLSVPDQSDALRIPPADRLGSDAGSPASGPCLESPPRFYEGLEEPEDAAGGVLATPPG